MNREMENFVEQAASLVANKQVEKGFLTSEEYKSFKENFLSGIDTSEMIDTIEHAKLALRVLLKEASIRSLDARVAGLRFSHNYDQSARGRYGNNHRRAMPTNVDSDGSVRDDHLVCLEDGKKVKLLKRHLRNHYGMSPDEYREKWGLPKDYPMAVFPTKMRNQMKEELQRIVSSQRSWPREVTQ